MPGVANRDLWKTFWEALDGRGGLSKVDFVKIKSHLTEAEKNCGVAPPDHIAANEAADTFAEEGAKSVEAPEADYTKIQEANRRAWAIQKRLLAVAELACATNKPEKPKKKVQPRGKINQQDRIHELNALGHNIYLEAGYYKCSYCMRVARKRGLAGVIERGNCHHADAYFPGDVRQCHSIVSKHHDLGNGCEKVDVHKASGSFVEPSAVPCVADAQPSVTAAFPLSLAADMRAQPLSAFDCSEPCDTELEGCEEPFLEPPTFEPWMASVPTDGPLPSQAVGQSGTPHPNSAPTSSTPPARTVLRPSLGRLPSGGRGGKGPSPTN